MNRGELVLALAEKCNIEPEDARRVIDILFDSMKQQLKDGGRIEFRGFGSFFLKEYRGYSGRNPRSGESVHLKEKRLPLFKCGKDLRDMLNGAD